MTKTFDATVTDIRYHGPDKAVIRLTPAPGFSYEAGQYIFLTFAGLEPRPYSIANAPKGREIEIHVKDTKAGGASSYAIHSLKTGEKVLCSGPHGQCTYKRTDRPVILIAGGMGITPLKAIMEEAIAQEHAPPIALYWGTNTMDDVYMDVELIAVREQTPNMSYRHILGASVGEEIAKEMNNLRGVEIYLAGPPAMISATVPLLLAHGAEEGRIHCDQTELLETLIRSNGMQRAAG